MKESACDILDGTIKAFLTGHEIENIDEIETGLISDLKNVTFNHHMDQPKSIICRKMFRRFFEVSYEDINAFKNIWIRSCIEQLLLLQIYVSRRIIILHHEKVHYKHKRNIKTKLLEDYDNFVDLTEKIRFL